MWPQLTNIDESIYNNLVSGSKAGMEANKRVAWVRVFSGAQISLNTGKSETVKGKDGKDIVDKNGKVVTKPITKPLNGLILSSANTAEIFKPAGESKLSSYGDSISSGDMGASFDMGNSGANISVSSGFGSALRPSPIITGIEIKEGKDQISRECTLKLKAFTLEQMELMQTYFLEPGYSLCIEYGWNTENALTKLINSKAGAGKIVSEAVNRNLNYDVLHALRVNSLGDYDTFLGFIVGGSVTSDNDKWDISVKLRGAPGLPTFLQTQNKTLEIDSKGLIVDKPGEPKPYGVSETEIESTGEDGDGSVLMRDRRFKNMFNQLPASRQTEAVKKLMGGTNSQDYLNFDAAVNKSITTYANPGWIARNFGGADNEIKVGKATIEKEKLFSKNKYIRFDLAVRILNANSQFTAYNMGGNKVSVHFDISKAKIGAFPKMFSTKPSKLVIPGWMPDFAVYFLNDGQIDQLKGGVLRSNGVEYGSQNNVVAGTQTQFVEQVPLTSDMDGDGLAENAGYWGYLKNLYINFDVFVEKLQQKNKNIREVFLDMLNEMSSAVNSFWNFQIVEGKVKGGKLIITVIDENWIGKRTLPIKNFFHSGPNSIFLDANIDISVPSEMTNQIISRRLALANNPDEPIVGVGGFFNSRTDLFLDSATNSDGKPRKRLTEAERTAEEAAKAEEQKEADKKPSEKAEAEISSKQTARTKNLTDIQALKKEQEAIRIKYSKAENGGARQGFVEGLQTGFKVVAKLWRDDEEEAEADKAEAAKDKAEDARDAELKVVQKKIDDLEAEAEKQLEEINELRGGLSDQKEKEVEEEEENKKSALSNNLAKIDVLPKPQISSLPADSIGDITDISVLKETFAIYCLNDEPFFDRMKNDAFSAKKNTGTLSHPLPIKYNFKIMGTSGIRRGDTFNIIGIPEKYRKHGLFQVTQLEQSLENMSWTTNITGEYRQKN
jgi:hypothetical protein